MISRTTASTPPPPPPPVSTMVVCSRSVPLSSAIENSPCFPCYRGETSRYRCGSETGEAMKRIGAVAAGTFMLAACNQAPSNSVQPADVARREAVPPIPPPGTGPDARTPLGRPENASDPKSPEAARGLVEQYCSLLQ